MSRFHAPPGPLRFFSFLYILLAPVWLIAAYQTRNPGYAIGGLVFGALALGIWMRSKICAYIFVIMLGGQCLAAIPLLVKDQSFDIRRFVAILIAGYTVFLVVQWLRKFPPESKDF